MNIPNDPAILFSFINTRLRDGGMTLDNLCAELSVSRQQIEEKLAAIGCTYDEKTNRFR